MVFSFCFSAGFTGCFMEVKSMKTSNNKWENDFELVKEKGEIGDWPEDFKEFRIWAPKKKEKAS